MKGKEEPVISIVFLSSVVSVVWLLLVFTSKPLYVAGNKFGLTKHDKTSGKNYQYRLDSKSYMNESINIYDAINVHF